MTLVSRVIREPLVHFLFIGLVVFITYDHLNERPSNSAPGHQIVVTLGDVNKLIAQFEGTWRRTPTRQELDALIEAQVRETILVQEALALSMDQNDAVINQRLSQKMTFLLESAARANTPSDAELRAHFDKNKDDYASMPMISFEQVYFGEAFDGADVERAVIALSGGADPSTFGQRTMLPPRLPISPPAAINGTFGRGFFETLAQSEAGIWTGPVRSGFGVHAVRVLESVPGTIPDFAMVADQVMADYIAASASKLSEAVYADMRARYIVRLPDASDLSEMLR